MKRLISLALLAALAACAHPSSPADILAPETLQQVGARVELHCLAVGRLPTPITQAVIDASMTAKAIPHDNICVGATTSYLTLRPDGSGSVRDLLTATSVRIPGAMLPASMHVSPWLAYYVVWSACTGRTYASTVRPTSGRCHD